MIKKNKIFNSKFFATLGLCSILSFGSFLNFGSLGIANASEVSSKPEVVLNEYLSSIKDKNVSKASQLSEDDRFESKEELKVFLNDILNEPGENLLSFNVLEVLSLEDNLSYVKAKLEYGNGQVIERAFKLFKLNDGWKVLISDEVPKKEAYKEIKKGEKDNEGKISFENEESKPFNSSFSRNIGITPRARLVTWSWLFGGGSGEKKYTATFTTASTMRINFRQYGGNPYNDTPTFEYAIVQKNTFGDTELAKGSHKGLEESAPVQLSLYPTANKKACLRVKFVGPSSSTGIKLTNFGELYN